MAKTKISERTMRYNCNCASEHTIRSLQTTIKVVAKKKDAVISDLDHELGVARSARRMVIKQNFKMRDEITKLKRKLHKEGEESNKRARTH